MFCPITKLNDHMHQNKLLAMHAQWSERWWGIKRIQRYTVQFPSGCSTVCIAANSNPCFGDSSEFQYAAYQGPALYNKIVLRSRKKDIKTIGVLRKACGYNTMPQNMVYCWQRCFGKAERTPSMKTALGAHWCHILTKMWRYWGTCWTLINTRVLECWQMSVISLEVLCIALL